VPADLLSLTGSWLLTYLVHSSVLLGVVWILSRRMASAAGRDVLWKAALLGGFLTTTLQLGGGLQPISGAVALHAGRADARLTQGERLAPETVATPAPDAWRGLIPAEVPAVRPLVEAPAVVTAPSPSASPVSVSGGGSEWVLPTALAAWLTVALLLGSLYLVQWARAMRRIGPRRPVADSRLLDMLEGLCRAGGVRRPIRLTAAPGLASPVALGRNEIALPEAALTDLDPDQQRSMLAHELAHLTRRDPTWLALACVIERLFFLQPLNRLARLRMQEAAEYLCDDWAVRRTGSGVSLATCLVKVAEWVGASPQPVPLAGMAERRSQLVTRIHRLIEGRVMPQSSRPYWLLGLAVGLIGATAVIAPGITPASSDLAAQGSVQAAPDSSISETTLHRLAKELDRARARFRVDVAPQVRALDLKLQGELARPAVAPRPPRPPRPPLAPAWGVGPGRDRPRDTTSIAVPALITALKDGDVEVRRAAAQSLANLGDPRAIAGLIDALRDSDAEVRATAASALGDFEDRRAVPGLIELLKDSQKDVRRAALSALGNFPQAVPTEAILTALADSDPDITVAALSLAGSCDCDEDKPADSRIVQAVAGLVGTPNAEVRSEAIGVLGSLGLKQAPEGLLTAGKDKNPEVRQRVAEALGSIRDPRAVPTLKVLVQDPNADVRESAINALGEIRDRAALEALVAALKSSDPVVRRHAAEALGQRDEGW
jgi:HEAT repeat protein/beta-lactamase regulating signal transducer with metallopeptidase domain